MNRLDQLFVLTTGMPVVPQITMFAQSLAEDVQGTVAVLAYGSALRDSNLADTLIDFYVLVEKPQNLSPNWMMQRLGQWLAPNVYYAEKKIVGAALRSKYAVITLERFIELTDKKTRNPYLWARFAQPSRIVWANSDATRMATRAALMNAARTAYAHALALSPESPWQTLFENTYRTELRPENKSRAALIVSADREYYAELSDCLSDTIPTSSSWAAKRITGKLWSVARLAKAAFTFQGGADYAAWKIARHSGVRIEVTDWQRKHPVLAGLLLLPRILRSKGLR